MTPTTDPRQPQIFKPVPVDRETDARIAIPLGWEQCACGNPACDFWVTPDKSQWDAELPHYSTSDAAALTILPAMRERGLYCKITYFYTDDYGVWASFDEQGWSDPNHLYQGHGQTIAQAIIAATIAWIERQG